MRLIDADALYAKVQEGEELARKRVLDTESTLPYPTNLNPAYTRYLAQMDERTKLKHMIDDAPTIHPKPPKIGKWNVYYHGNNDFSYSCNQCGYGAPFDKMAGKVYQRKWRYCPNCGVKMEGKNDENRSV